MSPVRYSPLCDVSEVAYLAYVYALTNGDKSSSPNSGVGSACYGFGQRRIEAVAKECVGKVAAVAGECADIRRGISVPRCVCRAEREELDKCDVDSTERDASGVADSKATGGDRDGGVSAERIGQDGPGLVESHVVDGCGLGSQSGSGGAGSSEGVESGVGTGLGEKERDSDSAGRGDDESSGRVVIPASGFGKHHARNVAKRKARAEARERSRVASAPVATLVPEWRRKEGGVGFHKGVFSECSEETQLALRESRAKMLIAKNKAAVIEAEERERKTAAMLKSRMIEENVEKERLELEKKMKVLRESAVMPQGYCETVLSALATPTLSDGTISPDSSISSAEVHKKDEAIKMLVNQCDEQRKESDKTKLALQEMSRKLEEFRLSSEKARKEKEDLIRERVRKERENMFAGRHGDGVKVAYESGKREYRGDDGTKIFWNTNADV